MFFYLLPALPFSSERQELLQSKILFIIGNKRSHQGQFHQPYIEVDFTKKLAHLSNVQTDSYHEKNGVAFWSNGCRNGWYNLTLAAELVDLVILFDSFKG